MQNDTHSLNFTVSSNLSNNGALAAANVGALGALRLGERTLVAALFGLLVCGCEEDGGKGGRTGFFSELGAVHCHWAFGSARGTNPVPAQVRPVCLVGGAMLKR